MAKKFKNFQNRLKVMKIEDIEDIDSNDLFEEDNRIPKFHKNDGTEYNKKDKPNLHKVKPFREFDV